MYLLFRNIPKARVVNKVVDYKQYETTNFIIKYKTSDNNIVELVARASEEYYDEICSKFDYYPRDKTLVILYDNSEDLLNNANLKESKPPMGVYYASTIQILSPEIWVKSNEDIETTFMNEGPMVHEFTHLIVDNIAKGNYPLWFTEGIALYEEYDNTGYEWGKSIKNEKIYTINQLNNNFNELNQYLAYTQSFRVVKYIVDKYGFDSIKGILRELGEGYTFDRAFENVTKDKIHSLNI